MTTPNALPTSLVFSAPRTTMELLGIGSLCAKASAHIDTPKEGDFAGDALNAVQGLVTDHIPEMVGEFEALRESLLGASEQARKQYLLFQAYSLASWATTAKEYTEDLRRSQQERDIEDLKGHGLGGIV